MTATQGSTEILKVDTEGRVRTPKEKQEEILEAYRGSGMTGQQFAAFCGVKYSTLMNWVGKARREGRKSLAEPARPLGVGWVEAALEHGKSGRGDGLRIEIGKGIRLEVFNSRQAVLAGEVLRSLEGQRSC